MQETEIHWVPRSDGVSVLPGQKRSFMHLDLSRRTGNHFVHIREFFDLRICSRLTTISRIQQILEARDCGIFTTLDASNLTGSRSLDIMM